jgi:hypothetical protein
MDDYEYPSCNHRFLSHLSCSVFPCACRIRTGRPDLANSRVTQQQPAEQNQYVTSELRPFHPLLLNYFVKCQTRSKGILFGNILSRGKYDYT